MNSQITKDLSILFDVFIDNDKFLLEYVHGNY